MIIIIFLHFGEFFPPVAAESFSLESDCKSPQAFRTLPDILADFNKCVVLMVSTRPHISKSFS